MSDIDALEALVLDNDFQELSRILKSRPPNIFSILGIEDSEVRWSAFLAWLFNPSENHGLGDKFLRVFLVDVLRKSGTREISLRPVEVQLKDLTDIEVRTEEVFGEKGRGDITIRCNRDRLFCIIENKVWSGERWGQTEGYADAVKKILKEEDFTEPIYVFLTPYGSPPQSPEFIAYDYKSLIRILDQCIHETEATPGIATELIHQFKRNVLEEIGMEESEEKIRTLCRGIYARQKEAIDKILEYMPTQEAFFKELFSSILEARLNFEPYFGPRYLVLSPYSWQGKGKNFTDVYYLIFYWGNRIVFGLCWDMRRRDIIKFEYESLKKCVSDLLSQQSEAKWRGEVSRDEEIMAEEYTNIQIPEDPLKWPEAFEKIRDGFADFLGRFPVAEIEKVPGVKRT